MKSVLLSIRPEVKEPTGRLSWTDCIIMSARAENAEWERRCLYCKYVTRNKFHTRCADCLQTANLDDFVLDTETLSKADIETIEYHKNRSLENGTD